MRTPRQAIADSVLGRSPESTGSIGNNEEELVRRLACFRASDERRLGGTPRSRRRVRKVTERARCVGQEIRTLLDAADPNNLQARKLVSEKIQDLDSSEVDALIERLTDCPDWIRSMLEDQKEAALEADLPDWSNQQKR